MRSPQSATLRELTAARRPNEQTTAAPVVAEIEAAGIKHCVECVRSPGTIFSANNCTGTRLIAGGSNNLLLQCGVAAATCVRSSL